MKNSTNQISVHILFILIGFALGSCNNDFLKTKQEIEALLPDTIFMTDLDQEMSVNFNVSNANNKHWRIQQLPPWLTILPLEGNFTNGSSSFQLQLPDQYAIPQWGYFDLPLIFEIEGLGLVKYPFQFLNFGKPHPAISTHLGLDLNSMTTLDIGNFEGGILVWEIKNKPAWLTVSKQNGFLEPGKGDRIVVSISRDNLVKGNYSGQINIAVNSPEKNIIIEVTMRVANPTISGTVETIEGDVVDAEYCKATGLMVLASKNPNRIYFIKSGQPLKSLDLNKIPVCVTISESGDVVAAAFTNTDLTLINPENLTITKNIRTGMISSDLALKGNSWAYLSPKQYDSYLLSVDLNSEQIIKNPTSMNGLSLLKKVPGKNLLYGSKVGWGPDFLIVYDISQGAAHDVADQWNVTLLNFCFSEDGQNIFTGTRKIYQGPAFLQKGFMHETPVLAGILEETATSVNSMDHCTVLKELFVVYKYNTSNGTRLLRIDDAGYFTKNAFSVNNCVVVENGNMGSLPTEVPYMHVSQSGKELHLVKKGIGSSKSYWFYEKISL